MRLFKTDHLTVHREVKAEAVLDPSLDSNILGNRNLVLDSILTLVTVGPVCGGLRS